MLNNQTATIRVHIQDGVVKSVNAFKWESDRALGKIINLVSSKK